MNGSQGSNFNDELGNFGAFLTNLKRIGPLANAEGGSNHCKRFSASMPPELKEAVTRRARELGLSRSHYIRLLVSADIGKEI